MRIAAFLIVLSSVIFAQNIYLKDVSKTAMPIFFEDSLRYNFSEVVDFKAGLGSYGTKTQLGLLSEYSNASLDSVYQRSFNFPSFYYVYNNFEGSFLVLGNEHINEKIEHDNLTSIDAKVDRGFVQYIKGDDHSKLSIGVDGEYGKSNLYKNTNYQMNKLYAINANVGTILKPGWDSEFLLEFNFELYKDSIRMNDYAVDGDTKFSNYVPDINIGFIKHNTQHRELGYFSWATNKRMISLFNTNENRVEFPVESEENYDFGFLGNYSLGSIPLGLSYSAYVKKEIITLYSSVEFKNQVASSNFRSYPLSLGFDYKFTSFDLVFKVDYNMIRFDVNSDQTMVTYFNTLSDIDDYELTVSSYIQFLKMKTENEIFETDLLFGLTGGYNILDPYKDGFMKFASYEGYEEFNINDYKSSNSTSEILLDNKMANGTITAGVKTTINKLFVADLKYDLNVIRDNSIQSTSLSDELFIGNNLLLKVYYLF